MCGSTSRLSGADVLEDAAGHVEGGAVAPGRGSRPSSRRAARAGRQRRLVRRRAAQVRADAHDHQILGLDRAGLVLRVLGDRVGLALGVRVGQLAVVGLRRASCSGVRRTVQTGLPRHSTVIFSPGLSAPMSASTGAPARRALGRGEGADEGRPPPLAPAQLVVIHVGLSLMDGVFLEVLTRHSRRHARPGFAQLDRCACLDQSLIGMELWKSGRRAKTRLSGLGQSGILADKIECSWRARFAWLRHVMHRSQLTAGQQRQYSHPARSWQAWPNINHHKPTGVAHGVRD